MYDGDTQLVLRCEQCNKPFDKQVTLKRHGYYCRSRKAGSTVRSRSCISCAKRKARCDNRQPECLRCITKAIKCHYPASTPRVTEAGVQHGGDAPERQNAASLPLVDRSGAETHQEASNDVHAIRGSSLAIPDPELEPIEREYLNWIDPDIDFANFLNSQTNDETFQFSSSFPAPRSSSLVRHSTPSTNQALQLQQIISSPISSIPPQPTSNIRSLTQRPKMKTATQRIAKLILHTLKSYPLMMQNHNNLPPFIHPHLLSSNIENSNMESLTNCINLVYMISSQVQGSRKLFWKNVRMECERLCEKYMTLNKWELLAAMQALPIYILIRLDEGETDHNNFDTLLIATVIMISSQLGLIDSTCYAHAAISDNELETRWKDWIFEESRRRLATVYRVINLLIYFEPAALCNLQKDLILAPLPAKKQLWEARDQFMWKAEIERDPRAEAEFGLAANGELVELYGGQRICGEVLLYKSLEFDARISPRSAGNWEEWCSGMDAFGGLVMLTASLVE